eukprot:scaffold271361_cov22-Tisochrysis_lutea.AAC.1
MPESPQAFGSVTLERMPCNASFCQLVRPVTHPNLPCALWSYRACMGYQILNSLVMQAEGCAACIEAGR